MVSPRLRNPDVVASNVLFAGWLFTLVGTVVCTPVAFQQPATAGSLTLSYTLSAGLFYAIRVGKEWAKPLFVLVFFVHVVPRFLDYEDTVQTLSQGGWLAVKDAVTLASRVLAWVLLLKPPLPERAE